MRAKLPLTLLIILSGIFTGCIESTSYSAADLSENYTKVSNEIKNIANAESVDFIDEHTMQGDKTVKRVMRIDLVKPVEFPGEEKIKQIILSLKSKLKDPAQFDEYTVNEVSSQAGATTVYPAPDILKSVTIKAKDL